MSKGLARGPQSYENEAMLVEIVPELLIQKGFDDVVVTRENGMKFVSASVGAGGSVKFWLKQGWTNRPKFSAIQFGFFEGEAPKDMPDEKFLSHVAGRVATAKSLGATHTLLVHMVGGTISNYVALTIDGVEQAYRAQMAGWPKKARNTRTPTLWFEDSRGLVDSECVAAVTEHEISLGGISGSSDAKDPPGVKKITVELERRMLQALFRFRVGEKFRWTCAITGSTVRAALDAAHLEGRNWRAHNSAEDGIMLRADLHRLFDRHLAELRAGRFFVAPEARVGDYAGLHGKQVPEFAQQI